MEDSPLPGGVFAGRYEVRDVIGRGATSVVYRARDLKHDRDVAVKVLRGELTHSLTADRFVREIGITARLVHPHILPLYDSGQADGRFFSVSPFIEGESLRSRLDRVHRLDPREAVIIARALAAALDCAHCHGIVHRDIKPENVLLASGQALLADFGIAHLLRPLEGERFTLTGLVVGTPQYMSPEQAAGDAVVDARSDIYSLGCMLYEMLTGVPPFSGSSVQAMIASRFAGDVPDVRDARADVPRALAELVALMAARSPAERVPTAAALSELLGAVEAECTTAVAPTHPRLGGRRLAHPGRWLRRHRRAVVGGAGALGLLLVAWLARDQVAIARLLERTPGVRTLAVLPLVNLTGDVQQEYFADGLTEALISDLSQLPGVNVISRTSVMQYKLDRKPMRAIARELSADALLEGALMRQGELVRITAKLVRGADEQNLWTASYDGRVGELFALQRTVGVNVAREIGARFTARAASRHAVKPESEQAYLKGAYYAGQWRLAEAIASFQQSVGVDPTNAAAYAALARAYYFHAFFGEVAPQEAFSQMRRAAGNALARDPQLGEAHGLMALVNTHADLDWASAERRFAQALALSPSSAQVHHDYAHFLLAMGRWDESVDESRRAVELDPANPMLTSCLGWHSLFDGRFDQSLRYAAEAQRMMPNYWALVVQGWAESGRGRSAEAVESMRQAVSLAPELGFTKAALAHALAISGDRPQATEVLASLLAQAGQAYVSAYDIAVVYAGLDERESAFEWLAKALAERSVFVVHMGWDARLRPLRGDRRYQELLERLAIPGREPSPKASKSVARTRSAPASPGS